MPHLVSPTRLLFGGVLTTILALAAAPPATAQSYRPSGPPGAERFKLTLPALRKVMPILQADRQGQCEKREERQNPFGMTLAEMAALLERCEPIRGALAKAGVSSEEAASVLGAFMYAGRRLTEEESALAMGNSAAPLPAGPLKDNVALLRENEAELRRLTQPSAAGSGR